MCCNTPNPLPYLKYNQHINFNKSSRSP